MSKTTRDEHWLANFRRALGYLRPHRRRLLIGLLAAAGVSVFYTFSVSSIVPILKIIFAEHETLVDWLNRSATQSRLGVLLPPDIPDDPEGLFIEHVRDTSPVAGVLRDGDRLVALAGQSPGAYASMRMIATHPVGALDRVIVVGRDGARREVALALRSPPWWWSPTRQAAQWLPAGRTVPDRRQTLRLVIGAFIVIGVLGAVMRFLNDGLVAGAVQRTMHDLRTSLAAHTLRLPVQWHSTQPAGDTLARFANDINKVEVGITTLFGKVVREPLKAVGVLSLALLIDWHMLLIGLVGLPIGIVVIRVFGRMVKRAQQRASQSWGRLLDHLGERLSGIREVKAFNMQTAESRRFSNEDQILTRAQTHIQLVDAGSRPALEMLASIAVSAFILYGGERVFQRQLEPHLFFGAVICLGAIFDPLRKMGNVYNRLQAAEAAAQRLFELLRTPPEEPAEPAAATSLPALQREIEFCDVSFCYPSNPQRRVLDEVNLIVPKGRVVALVGPNGSGKTTLVSLLLRFFEPTGGEIRIDGVSIADVPLAELRRQIGLVTQDAVIFSDSVRANIAYGANGATDEDITRAAQRAHVDDFIRALHVEHNGQTTCGYDARVSGRTLSGGQRQRLVLARAILRNPAILILDEATSQVDAESEQKIQAALEDVTRDRTTFIIAHRFSTIARADMTVVLNEGRVVAVGHHEDLRHTCPFYDQLVKTQFAQGV